MRRSIPAEQRKFARAQRANMSAAERALWAMLRAGRLGWKFKRQIPIGPYVADFVCFEARRIVESGGPAHREPLAKRHDRQRDMWLRGEGFAVLRLSNDLIFGAPELAAEQIKLMLTKEIPS
jgi:very-short-patch-repair endonuclease